MLYFSSMTEDHELWSEWVRVLREQGLHELVAWLIRAGKPGAIILSQAITLVMPILIGNPQDRKLDFVTKVLEDGDQLEAFARALLENGGKA